MLLTEKKLRCPTCGAKNPVGRARCVTCTRPLTDDGGPAAEVYRAALWGEAIDSKRRSQVKVSPWALLALAVVVGLGANWFWFKAGPDWLHEPHDVVRAADWKTYRGEAGFRIDLPGEPIRGSVAGPAGTMSTSTVWVDGNWLLVRDEGTRSAGALASARDRLHAILVAASGPAPDPATVRDGAAAAVRALAGGATLTDLVTTELQDPAAGQQFEVRARFSGAPDERGRGDLQARVIVVDGRMLVAASMTQLAPDEALSDELLRDFTPEG